MDFFNKLQQYFDEGCLPEKYRDILFEFYRCYKETLEEHHIDVAPYVSIFLDFLDLVKDQIQSPYAFLPYHQQILSPFNYYSFGVEFIRPLVDKTLSTVRGLDHLAEANTFLQKGGNVVFLANHQIEADPQAISILIEEHCPRLAQEMIFVAGERVVTDPLAIPFSMGRNLLCIYSKRYIDHPPEQKRAKQMHNKKTMELMSELLSQGGHAIYVAPSGGRDRANAEGKVEVAPFDPNSIEMFYLMTQKAKQPTCFYPMALSTYDLLPPPQTIQVELGEKRQTKRGDIHLAIGPKIDMERFPGHEEADKHIRRQLRADYICSLVKQEYSQFPSQE